MVLMWALSVAWLTKPRVDLQSGLGHGNLPAAMSEEAKGKDGKLSADVAAGWSAVLSVESVTSVEAD